MDTILFVNNLITNLCAAPVTLFPSSPEITIPVNGQLNISRGVSRLIMAGRNFDASESGTLPDGWSGIVEQSQGGSVISLVLTSTEAGAGTIVIEFNEYSSPSTDQ